jgi:hypothetical protein
MPIQRDDWLCIPKLVDHVLNNPSIAVESAFIGGDSNQVCTDAVPTFLTIFSLSQNFDTVLDALNTTYLTATSADSDTSGMGMQVWFVFVSFGQPRVTHKASILSLVTKFLSKLWLTDRQINKIAEYFVQRSTVPGLAACVAYERGSLIECLQRLQKRNASTLGPSIASLDELEKTTLELLAQALAEALAVLEDKLRRTDSVGECVRWMTRNYTRDFISFPERVCPLDLPSRQ